MDVQLGAKLIFKLSVDCDPGKEVGMLDGGFLTAIPITGGTFEGDGLNGEGIRGKVLCGGADWNTRFGPNPPEETEASHVFAKYLIQTDDGVLIHIENGGYKSWKPGAQTKIITTPHFQVQKDSKYAWLNYGVYVGTLESREDHTGVEIQIFRMD